MSTQYHIIPARRFNLIITLALCFLATACAPKPWLRDNTSQAEFDKDHRECAYEAMKVAAPYEEFKQGRIYNRVGAACMTSRGYTH